MNSVTRWMRAHKILTAVLVLVVLVALGGSAEEEPVAEAGSTSAGETQDADSFQPEADIEPVETGEEEPAVEDPSVEEPTEALAEPIEATEPEPAPAPKPKKKIRLYPVLEVVDGDTVKVAYRGGVSVRVIGIDTPETVDPNTPDECWGKAASDAAESLLAGESVRLVFDPTQGRTDAYGRTLAYLEAPGLGDFGLAMLKRGHAAEYTYDTAYQRQARYRSAEAAAESASKAMWDQCGGPDKPLKKKPRPAPQPFVGGGGSGNCQSGYDPCVPSYPPDVDCGDVNGPIAVSGSDPHGLDGEGDGIACE